MRRETGKEQVVEVHCDERGAIHIGPKPRVHARESMGEASAGERTGQPSSLDKNSNPDAVVVHWAEGNTDGARDRECPDDPAWPETLLRHRLVGRVRDWLYSSFHRDARGIVSVDRGGDVETFGEC